QILVAQDTAVPRFALPDNRCLIFARTGEMAIQAVVTGVELAADEPLGEWLLPLQHLVPLGKPGQGCRLLGPETLRIATCPLVKLLIFGERLDVGLGGKCRRRRKLPRFLEDAGDIRGRRRGQRVNSWKRNRAVDNSKTERTKGKGICGFHRMVLSSRVHLAS